MVGTAYALIDRVTDAPTTSDSATRGVLRPETATLMIIANFLAIHFFAMLKDEGSWLEIGESISHYVIGMSIGLASVLLSHLGGWLLMPPWVATDSGMKLL